MTVLPARTTKTFPSPVATSSCVNALSPVLTASAAARSPPAAWARSSARVESASVAAATFPVSSNTTAAWICEEISVRSASACWASIVGQSIEASLATAASKEGRGPTAAAVDGILRDVRLRRRDLVQKFYADRGPHLAAMIAYFALLSFVPLTFISLALLGLTGRADESSFLVREIKKTLPGTPIDQIINLAHAVQVNAATLGIIGGLALLWTSLSLFSVLESALNIVYGRPNRSFLQGKGLAFLLMVGSLVTLFVALLAGSLGVTALQEYLPGVVSNAATAYALSIGVSLVGVFLFLLSCYYVLTNEDDLRLREVLPGAIFAAVLLEATFQVLPLYQRYADLNPALRAFGAPAILLVWLYVMANVIVLGAELNWWRARRAEQRQDGELAGLA